MEPQPDISGEVSPGLSQLLLAVANDPERTEESTLGVALAYANGGWTDQLERQGRMDPHVIPDVISELEQLIDRYGAEAAVSSFLRYRASPDLATVINAVMAERGMDRPPTLGTVRRAIDDGALANLEGQGALDGDEDQLLRVELDRLIQLHGADALAEDVV